MNPNDPKDANMLLTAGLMLVLAMWGGLVNYISRIKSGTVKTFSVVELLGEFVISGFSGFLVYLLAVHLGVDQLLTAVLVGIAGHAGGRTIFFIERAYASRFEALTGRINGSKKND